MNTAFARNSLPPSGFVPVDLRVVIDVNSYIKRVPRHAKGKGMFLMRLLEELDRRGIPRPTSERFLPFTDYPLQRCLELNVEAARLMFPTIPLSDGLRRVAWTSFDTFANSLIGQVLFGAVRHDVESILRLSSRALAYTTNVGTYELEVVRNRTAVFHVHDAYLFAEYFAVGMLEGVLRSCDCQGEILSRMDSQTSGAFYVRW